jgi:hypothetical protein
MVRHCRRRGRAAAGELGPDPLLLSRSPYSLYRVAAPVTDPHVDALARFYATHPACVAASRHVRPGASSKIFFTHRPGEPWHLLRSSEGSRLEPGPAKDPDFAFCFPPRAIDRLTTTGGDVGDFAVALFSLIVEADASLRVGFRVIASWPRLARSGYVRLLLAGGPQILAFGASHGVRSAGQLRRFVNAARSRAPEDWEVV